MAWWCGCSSLLVLERMGTRIRIFSVYSNLDLDQDPTITQVQNWVPNTQMGSKVWSGESGI